MYAKALESKFPVEKILNPLLAYLPLSLCSHTTEMSMQTQDP